MVSCLPGAAFGRLDAMTARRLSSPDCLAAFRLPQSLLCNSKHSLNPLESALPQVLIVRDLKSFRMNVYKKTGGSGDYC